MLNKAYRDHSEFTSRLRQFVILIDNKRLFCQWLPVCFVSSAMLLACECVCHKSPLIERYLMLLLDKPKKNGSGCNRISVCKYDMNIADVSMIKQYTVTVYIVQYNVTESLHCCIWWTDSHPQFSVTRPTFSVT